MTCPTSSTVTTYPRPQNTSCGYSRLTAPERKRGKKQGGFVLIYTQRNTGTQTSGGGDE